MARFPLRLRNWLALALAAACPAAAEELVYLHVIPVTASQEAAAMPDDADAGSPLQVGLEPATEDGFAPDWLSALGASASDDGAAVFTLDGYPRLGGPVTEAHRAASFLIDFDEPEVQELSARLVAEHGESPSLAELIRFTDQTISIKNMARGWDLPSRVARNGEGDCTEHAVLLTALARSTGQPARAVIGFVLVWLNGSVEAYGHAWSEIHDGSEWRLADGTGIDRQAPTRYVPMAVVDAEGPDYQFRLLGQMIATWPKRVDLRRAPAGR